MSDKVPKLSKEAKKIGKEILSDTTEAVIDAFRQPEVVKNIPIVKWLALGGEFVGAYRDALLARKLEEFFSEYEDLTSDEERERFKQRYQSDPDWARRIGEMLILMLDNFEDMNKAEILAKIFVAMVKERITSADYERLASSLMRVHLPDLTALKAIHKRNPAELVAQQDLANCGLLQVEAIATVAMPGDKVKYELSELGKLMYQILYAF